MKQIIRNNESYFCIESSDSRQSFIAKVIKEEEGGKVIYHFYDKNSLQTLIAFLYLREIPEKDTFFLCQYKEGGESEAIGIVIREKSPTNPSTYLIYDKDETLVAKGSLNWLNTRLIITDPQNDHKDFATCSRPYFKLPGDKWVVKIHSKCPFSSTLVALIVVFQADCETRNCVIKPQIDL